MVAMAATVKLHKTSRDDSEEHEGSEERRRDEIGEGNKETRSVEEKSAEGENEKRETVREGIEESRDEARGDPHDNGEGDTRGEPQHEHRGLENGKYETFKRETLEFGENKVHEQGSSSTNTRHRKARTMGYESPITAPCTPHHLAQPTRLPTQGCVNTRGSIG
jgi:hypothetical protein